MLEITPMPTDVPEHIGLVCMNISEEQLCVCGCRPWKSQVWVRFLKQYSHGVHWCDPKGRQVHYQGSGTTDVVSSAQWHLGN